MSSFNTPEGEQVNLAPFNQTMLEMLFWSYTISPLTPLLPQDVLHIFLKEQYMQIIQVVMGNRNVLLTADLEFVLNRVNALSQRWMNEGL